MLVRFFYKLAISRVDLTLSLEFRLRFLACLLLRGQTYSLSSSRGMTWVTWGSRRTPCLTHIHDHPDVDADAVDVATGIWVCDCHNRRDSSRGQTSGIRNEGVDDEPYLSKDHGPHAP